MRMGRFCSVSPTLSRGAQSVQALEPRDTTELVPELEEERHAEVIAALGDVLDPELDEPVTAMGFIESVTLRADDVEVVFRLPTYWCSANFAFLMATDMKGALEHLHWVRGTTIRLVDHFASRKINQGVSARQGFSQVFLGEAQTGLDDIRRVFGQKAFLSRQERLLRLLAERWGIEGALRLTVGGLRRLLDHDDQEIRSLALRYLGMRLHDGGSVEDDTPAFTTLSGLPVSSTTYADHLRAARRVRSAAEANAEMCRMYLSARKSHPAPGCRPEDREQEGEP
jgi:metal-sulfur cluster biosynthetic enzyme